ncbi:alpha/beta fold hydrolase [Nocardia sp. NPDC003482]
MSFEPVVRRVATNGVELNVAVAGRGPAVVLLHGFPHTWELWRGVMGALAPRYRMIAPDLRGLGASSRPEGGYDAGTVAADVVGLLDALGERDAVVVGIDAGAPPAFLTAYTGRVRGVVLMESLLGGLPAAEGFSGGAPWWFGFHAVPGLAETVLVGHEDEYIEWFLRAGTLGRGVPEPVRSAFLRAYRGSAALRSAFEYYRAMPESARQIAAASSARLTVPTLAIGSHPVGRTLGDQLRSLADDLTTEVIPDCGHIIPIDAPETLVALLSEFLARASVTAEP